MGPCRHAVSVRGTFAATQVRPRSMRIQQYPSSKFPLLNKRDTNI